MFKKILKSNYSKSISGKLSEVVRRDLKYWKRVAKDYDKALSIYEDTAEERSKLYEQFEDDFLDRVVDECIQKGPTIFIEIGSGTGRYIVRYGCRMSKTARHKHESERYSHLYDKNLLLIVGLDFSYSMIEMALKKIKKARLDKELWNRILLINGLAEEFSLSLEAIPEYENAQRVVCCMFNTLGNIEPFKRRLMVLKRINELLSKNGVGVISVFNADVFFDEAMQYYTHKMVRKLVCPPGGKKLLFGYPNVRTEDFVSHWFRKDEIIKLIKRSGLTPIEEPLTGIELLSPLKEIAKRGIIIKVKSTRDGCAD